MPRPVRSRRTVVARRAARRIVVARRAAALLIAAGATVAPGPAAYAADAAEKGTTTRRLSDGTVAPPPAVVEPPPDWVDPFAAVEPAAVEPAPENPTVVTPVAAIAEPPADPVAGEHPADGPLFGEPVAEAALLAEAAAEEKQEAAAAVESEADGSGQEVAEPAVMVLFDFATEGAAGAAGAGGDPRLAGEVTTAEELFAGAEPAAPLDPFDHSEPAVAPEPGPEPPAPLPPAPAGRASLALVEPPPVGRAFLEFAPVSPAPVAPAPSPVHTPNRLPSPALSGAPFAAALAPARPVQSLPVQSLPGVRTAVARRPGPGAARGAGMEASAVALPAAFGRFCPVAVRDARRLAAADPRVTTEFGGKTYQFASPVARAAFLLDPDRYLPVADGRDVVLAAAEGFAVPGRVEHAVLYGGRLFLFRSARTRDAFAADPARFVDADAPVARGATPIAAPGELR